MNWFVVYTRPRWEKKVVSSLNRLEIENYCPLNKLDRQWSDRKKKVDMPLFTSYVFVRVNEQDKWRAKDVEGVLNYVYWLGKPAVIPNHEIELIKQFLSEHQSVNVGPLDLKINDQVKIISGPFIDQNAAVIGINGKNVKLQIPSLRLSLTAILKISDLQLI